MYTNITVIDRAFRIAISLGVVLAVLNMSGPLGSMVYALFVSIYLGITAFIGWDPIAALMGRVSKGVSARPAHVHGRLVTQ
jgi:hypothetical protein